MPKFEFCYDLHDARSNPDPYSKITEEIQRKYLVSLKILNTTFLIKTSDYLTTVNANLKAILTKYSQHFECFTTEVVANDGWLAPEKWEWIRKNF